MVIPSLFYKYISTHFQMMTLDMFLSSYCLHFLKPDMEIGIFKTLFSLGMYAMHRKRDCLRNINAAGLYSSGSQHCKKKKKSCKEEHRQ